MHARVKRGRTPGSPERAWQGEVGGSRRRTRSHSIFFSSCGLPRLLILPYVLFPFPCPALPSAPSSSSSSPLPPTVIWQLYSSLRPP